MHEHDVLETWEVLNRVFDNMHGIELVSNSRRSAGPEVDVAAIIRHRLIDVVWLDLSTKVRLELILLIDKTELLRPDILLSLLKLLSLCLIKQSLVLA